VGEDENSLRKWSVVLRITHLEGALAAVCELNGNPLA